MPNQADIVTLKKGDIEKYIRTHIDAVDGLDIFVENLLKKEKGVITVEADVDIVRQDLTKSNGTINGNLIIKMKNNTDFVGSRTIAQLPEGFRPKSNWQYYVCVNGTTLMIVNIATSGIISNGSYPFTGGTQAVIPANAYISLNFEFNV